MKTTINVECMDQELTITNSPVIASGGVHENFIVFNFCNKWDGFSKTAVFYRNEREKFYSIVDDNNMCEVPHEVTDYEGTMFFGVLGVKGETVRTSRVLKYKIKQGAITDYSKPSDPTPDIYQQLLSDYNTIISTQTEFIASQETLMNEYHEAWSNRTEEFEKDVLLLCDTYADGIVETTETTLQNSLESGLKIDEIGGKSEQNGTPSPDSPDSPVEIKSVTINGIKTCGGNLLDLSDAKNGKDSGIEVTINADGSYKYKGTATAENINVWLLGAYSATKPILTLKAGTYYIKGVNLYYNRGNVFVNGRNGEVVTFAKDTPISAVRAVNASSGVTYDETQYPIIALSDVEIPWKLHEKSVATLSNPIKLNGIGEVKDRLIRKDGVWQIERKVKSYTFTGNESGWNLSSTRIGSVWISFDKLKLPKGILYQTSLCSHFSTVTVIDNYTKYGQALVEPSAFNMWMKDGTVSGESEVKEFLANRNVTFLYVMETPTYEALPDADQVAFNSLQTFDGITHLYCDSEIEPTFIVQYATSKTGAVALQAYLAENEVVDNLLSTSTRLPLSAKQGKILNEKLDTCLYIVSFDASTGTLITKSADYKG